MTVLTNESGEIQPAVKREQEIADILKDEKVLEALMNVLPKHLDTNRFARIALGSLRRNKKLMQCNPQSFLTALLQVASLGLEPDTPLGHAYLIPYGTEATLVVGYEGYIDLAYRSGVVVSIHANVVRTGDHFEWMEGSNPTINHKPNSIPQMYSQGGAQYQTGRDVTHIYAIAKLLGGGHVQAVLTKAEVDALKSRSRASHDGPWVTDPVAMMKKTAIRQLRKFMPMSPQARNFHVAAALDEQVDSGLVQTFEVGEEVFEVGQSNTEAEIVESNIPDEGVCPEHGEPWRVNKFGLSHRQGDEWCSPKSLAYGWCENAGISNEDLNQFLKNRYDITRSKIDKEHLDAIKFWITAGGELVVNADGTEAWPE